MIGRLQCHVFKVKKLVTTALEENAKRKIFTEKYNFNHSGNGNEANLSEANKTKLRVLCDEQSWDGVCEVEKLEGFGRGVYLTTSSFPFT